MGMFDGLKNWFNRTFGNKQKQLTEGLSQSTVSGMGAHVGSNIFIKDVISDEYAHQNPYGQESRLYTVRVSRMTDQKLSGYPITFELPAYMSLDDAIKNGALEVLLANQARPEFLNESSLTNIGGITILQNEQGESQWGIHGSTEEVNNYINGYIKPTIDASLVKEDTPRSISQPQPAQVIHNEGAYIEHEPQIKGAGRFKDEVSYRINNPENGNVTELRLKDAINPITIRHRDNSIDYVYTAFRQKLGKSFDAASNFGMQLEEINFALPYPIETLYNSMNGFTNELPNAAEHARLLGVLVDNLQLGRETIEGISFDPNGNPQYITPENAFKLYQHANPAIINAKNEAIRTSSDMTKDNNQEMYRE